ncbi:MAG TPA: hypothetical protein VGD97_07315 [Lacunisphaera sp.]
MKLGSQKEQTEWLGQHIPHRVRACLAGSPDLWRLLNQQAANPEEGSKKYEFCRDMAMYEGRHAAVRWLIEFVGVSSWPDGRPRESAARRNKGQGKQFDVDIMHLPGGRYFDLAHKDAKLLAEVWLASTQATSHPTFESKHPSLAGGRIVTAAKVVMDHMARTVYATAGMNVMI